MSRFFEPNKWKLPDLSPRRYISEISAFARRKAGPFFQRVKNAVTHTARMFAETVAYLAVTAFEAVAAPFKALFSKRKAIRPAPAPEAEPAAEPAPMRRVPRIVLNTGLVVLLVGAAAFLYWALTMSDTSKTLKIADDGRTTTYLTKQETLGALLDAYGITLGEGDEMDDIAGSAILDGQTVEIRHTFPVAVASGGQVTVLTMHAGQSVGEALALADVAYDADDELTHLAFEDVTPGLHVQHIDVRTEYATTVSTIYYKEETIKDSSRYEGTVIVRSVGSNGEKEITRRLVYRDGVLSSREIVDQVILKPAVDEVTVVGTKIRYQTSFTNDTRRWRAAPKDSQVKEVLLMEVTAYTESGRTRTATGTHPKLGTIAVNPKIIPYGTRLYVPGYGYGIAEDTGAFRNYEGGTKMQIDVFLATEKECRRWGRKRNVKVYVLK